MAAKLLHTLTDENPDLQLGCMTGLFQLFDRQNMISGRRISGHNPKRLLPGSSHISGDQQTAKEKTSNKNVNEKQRVSTESSRPSFSSSSRSSSYSSLDCNRTAQPEQTLSRDPSVNQSSASPQFGRLSLDIRNVVKDSMNREAQAVKQKDSPRPLQVPKSADATYSSVGINGKKNLPADLKESLKALAKLREAPWYYNEAKEHSRLLYESKDGYLFSNTKDTPRFSCDGREITHLSFESRETFKSTPKVKELPRLSLDSREGSFRGFESDSKTNFLFRNTQKDSSEQASGTQARPPGLVAKLMGLEALPDAALASDNEMGLIKTCPVENIEPSSQSSKSTVPCRPIQVSNPSRNSWKEPTSPRWKNRDSVMKPVSRFPMEPAPWKQPDGTRGSQKPSFRHLKAQVIRPTNSFPSVYCEIEKRLKDLTFTQSGKDLRALKQILEAMQAKGLLDSKKEEVDSNFETQRDHEPRHVSPNERKPQSRVSNSSRTFESPIVIMKPATLVEKSGIPSSSVIPIDGLSSLPKLRNGDSVDIRKGSVNSRTEKDQIPKTSSSLDKKTSSRNLKAIQSLNRPQELPKENTTNSVKSSGYVSSRFQQNKLELEKRSWPPTPPSDSIKSRRQYSKKHQTESSSSGGKCRPKSSNWQQSSNEQLGEVSSGIRNSSYQEDDIPMQSEGNIVFDSKIDVEVTSSDRSAEINGSPSPSLRAANYSISRSTPKKSTVTLSQDSPLGEIATVVPEHPSPVSVLDETVYRDDAPSLVKRIPSSVKDDGTWNPTNNSGKEQRDPADNLLSNITWSGLTSQINRKKLQNIENLVQKLRRLNSNHDEAHTDYIASLCENTNPDDRYISEILLASGLLLRDLGSSLTTFQLHSSGHPINPELFLVLEQTKGSTEKVANSKPEKEKFHRKLIFDAVNEILVGKLASVGCSTKPLLKPKKVARKTLNGQKLLRELCSEIEQLQAKKPECSLENEDDGLKSILWDDVMSLSESWNDFQGEISVVVLDIERLIFKDLVNEIVIGEAARSRGKPGRHCRRLFAK